MNKNYYSKWRRWIPYLELYLNLNPLIAIQSAIMTEQCGRDAFNYVRLEITLIRKKMVSVNLWKKPGGK